MGLHTFLDLGYLVRQKAVSFAVDGLHSFLARSFRKAENLAALLVEPILVVLDPILVLDFHVLPVSLGHRLCG
jgi:hypothetical protein